MKKITLINTLIVIMLIYMSFSIGNIEGINNSKNLKISFGNYKTQKYGFFTKAILYIKGVRHLPKINALNINEDSTFYYESCRKSRHGKWIIVNDTLILIEKFSIEDSIQNNTLRQKKYKIIDNNTLEYIYNDETSHQRLILNK